ncbi:MAG: hypothetical protein B5M53_02105 [Candidatus Cloacimonas sp. 4484_209]|nr:MAG: hypothetical protein B5M53_02105 [Candidatus Cloacimonas sp. 4484_209]
MNVNITYKKILVMKTRSVGDNIVMLPALRLLRIRFPHSIIKVLTATESISPLLHLPYIDGIYSFQKKTMLLKRIWQSFLIIRKIREYHFDLLICFEASNGDERLSLFLGARKRLIYPYKYGRRSRFSHFDVGKDMIKKQSVQEDIDALEPLGIHSDKPQFHYPLSDGAIAYAKKFLYKPCSIGLRDSFEHLAAIINESLIFIGNDSAPSHLACMLNVPSITLMSKDRRNTWFPYDRRYHKVLVGEVKKTEGKFIDRITTDEVFSIFEKLVSTKNE